MQKMLCKGRVVWLSGNLVNRSKYSGSCEIQLMFKPRMLACRSWHYLEKVLGNEIRSTGFRSIVLYIVLSWANTVLCIVSTKTYHQQVQYSLITHVKRFDKIWSCSTRRQYVTWSIGWTSSYVWQPRFSHGSTTNVRTALSTILFPTRVVAVHFWRYLLKFF